MQSKPTRTGRPRRYGLPPLPGFVNPELAAMTARLRELAERVYDQIADLPQEALDYCPQGTKLSIGRLVAHLAWAEALWVSRLTGAPVPGDLQGGLDIGALTAFDRPPAPSAPAAELIAFCRRVQESYSGPALSRVADVGTPLEAGGRTVNVRGVLSQLEWHWAYHSGQIGLLRLQWGSDYTWSNEAILG